MSRPAVNLSTSSRIVVIIGSAVLTLSIATAALADPCKAIPDRGPMPAFLHSGAVFSGLVVYVADGDGLCLDVGGNRQVGDWVEVRLADFYAPELAEPGGAVAKATLARITMGREVSCTADHRSYDRVVARCTLRGVSLGDLMRRAKIIEDGHGHDGA